MAKTKVIQASELAREPGATATLSDYKDTTDPKYVGPGAWNTIHRMAFNAQNSTSQFAFISFMKETCHGFPCTVCRGHCTDYIKNYPMEDYLNTMVEMGSQKLSLGMFIWSWRFHNAVNARLKKPMMSWDTAYNLYAEKDGLVCSKECLASAIPEKVSHNNDKIPTVNPPIIKPFVARSIKK